ncbi:hypothetical protein [Bacillus safensis]|uniref:hypothetical protein n=1 Tax=Bacillus safensis TaxID=561879 RepID=UPI00364ABDA3
MSRLPILLTCKHLAELDDLTPRRERYMFQRQTQPGALTFEFGTERPAHRVETTVALEARGMSTSEHRRYLRNLPVSLPLDDVADLLNLSPVRLAYLGVVDEDGTVFVRNAFKALGLDVSLLGTPDN